MFIQSAVNRKPKEQTSVHSPKRRVRMSIEKFNVLLHSEEKSELIAALSDLTAIEEPEDLLKATNLAGWGYWA